MTFIQAGSSHEAVMEKTQVLPPTQPMGDEGTREGLDPVSMTQSSTLAGISHGVGTQILRNAFGSLPPSSQINESEMLGSVICMGTDIDLTRFHRS